MSPWLGGLSSPMYTEFCSPSSWEVFIKGGLTVVASLPFDMNCGSRESKSTPRRTAVEILIGKGDDHKSAVYITSKQQKNDVQDSALISWRHSLMIHWHSSSCHQISLPLLTYARYCFSLSQLIHRAGHTVDTSRSGYIQFHSIQFTLF